MYLIVILALLYVVAPMADFEISDDDDEPVLDTPPQPPHRHQDSNQETKTSRAFTRIDNTSQQTITQITEQLHQHTEQRQETTLFRAGSFMVHHSGENSEENSQVIHRTRSKLLCTTTGVCLFCDGVVCNMHPALSLILSLGVLSISTYRYVLSS